jgi:hypothetical protein
MGRGPGDRPFYQLPAGTLQVAANDDGQRTVGVIRMCSERPSPCTDEGATRISPVSRFRTTIAGFNQGSEPSVTKANGSVPVSRSKISVVRSTLPSARTMRRYQDHDRKADQALVSGILAS